jgi:hypothetical protein
MLEVKKQKLQVSANAKNLKNFPVCASVLFIWRQVNASNQLVKAYASFYSFHIMYQEERKSYI